jgi:predicted nucleic acid-binding protein
VKFYALLTTYPHLEWVPPGLEIADLAARFRALHRLRTPDAIHAATAAHAKVTGFITNESAFQRIANFETLLLDTLIETHKNQ